MPFCTKLRPHFQTTFALQLFFLFSILNSRMSRNMRKLRHKVGNGQNLPHGNPNFGNNFDGGKSLSPIKIVFLLLGFQKGIVSNRLNKIH